MTVLQEIIMEALLEGFPEAQVVFFAEKEGDFGLILEDKGAFIVTDIKFTSDPYREVEFEGELAEQGTLPYLVKNLRDMAMAEDEETAEIGQKVLDSDVEKLKYFLAEVHDEDGEDGSLEIHEFDLSDEI